MRIRAVASDELHRLKELRSRALRDAPKAFGSRLEDEQLRDAFEWNSWVSRGCTFVAEDEAGWHGMVAVFPDQHDESRFELISMWVEPGWRGRGLGGRLLAAGIAWAQERGAVDPTRRG